MNRNTNNGTKIKAIDVFMSEKHRAEMALAKLGIVSGEHFLRPPPGPIAFDDAGARARITDDEDVIHKDPHAFADDEDHLGAAAVGAGGSGDGVGGAGGGAAAFR